MCDDSNICGIFIPSGHCAMDDSKSHAESEEDDKDSFTLAEGLSYLVGFGMFGNVCVVFCTWWLVMSKSYLDFSPPLLKWMSGATYGVYVIHLWVINATAVLCVMILDAMHATRYFMVVFHLK